MSSGKRRWGAAVLGAVATGVAGAFAASEPPPSPFHMNQLGVEAGSPAIVLLTTSAARPLRWTVRNAARRIVASGDTRPLGPDPQSGETPHRIVVPRLLPGSGYVIAASGAVSRPFTVAPAPFHQLARDAMSFFYQQRSGVPIERAFVPRSDLARAAGHRPDLGTCFQGADLSGQVWPACAERVDVTGGWYDAGDHGKYVVNGGVAVWTLLNAHERGLRAGTDVFPDGTLALPERNDAVSDLLDEARWEVEFLLRMQVPDGRRIALPHRGGAPSTIDAGGLAYHKIADRQWTPLPTAPADDHEPRILYPPSTAATLNLAAVAAQAARVWRSVDPAFAARCLLAARRAWTAAERYPALMPARVTQSGDYADEDLSDERFWAAAELYRSTGEERYRRAVDRSPHLARLGDDLSWSDVAAAGAATLAFGPADRERAAARRAIVARADRYRAEARVSAYGLPFTGTRFVWGSNGVMMNRALLLGLAHELTGQAAYRDTARDALDYLLGRNALDRSFVSGYGARPMRHAHHRFWAHEADPRYPDPPPGVLSGGPNAVSHGEGAAGLPCVGMTCWHDDHRLFTENEVAINWNAPLVWVASYLDATAPNATGARRGSAVRAPRRSRRVRTRSDGR